MKTKKYHCPTCENEQTVGAICTHCGMDGMDSIGPPIPSCGHEVIWNGGSYISMGVVNECGALSIAYPWHPLEHIAFVTDWKLP